ncbi:hypothetical protein ACF0H5_014827 [Mactra antiquata]
MSHNWRHYSKKIKLSDSKDMKSITTFFKKKNVGLNQSCSASVSSTATVSLCESETEPEGTTEVTSPTVDDVDIGEKSENIYTGEKHDSHMDSDNRSISVNITANDMRKFNLAKYETKFPWLFHSAVHRGYMCKYCELFAPKLDKSTPYVTCGAILGTHPTRRLEMHQSSETHLKSTTRYTSSLCNEAEHVQPNIPELVEEPQPEPVVYKPAIPASTGLRPVDRLDSMAAELSDPEDKPPVQRQREFHSPEMKKRFISYDVDDILQVPEISYSHHGPALTVDRTALSSPSPSFS